MILHHREFDKYSTKFNAYNKFAVTGKSMVKIMMSFLFKYTGGSVRM